MLLLASKHADFTPQVFSVTHTPCAPTKVHDELIAAANNAHTHTHRQWQMWECGCGCVCCSVTFQLLLRSNKQLYKYAQTPTTYMLYHIGAQKSIQFDKFSKSTQNPLCCLSDCCSVQLNVHTNKRQMNKLQYLQHTYMHINTCKQRLLPIAQATYSISAVKITTATLQHLWWPALQRQSFKKIIFWKNIQCSRRKTKVIG